MKQLKIIFGILLFLYFVPFNASGQDSLRFYVNAGYITNLKKCEDCTKADAGGSIRIGILTKGRMGYYVGYLWFKEFHKDFIEYDDKGRAFLGGIDFCILKKNNFRWYVQAGLEIEKFISTYPNGKTDTEINPKPDFGCLFNFNHVNAFVGWQPSEPAHINFGIGFTI